MMENMPIRIREQTSVIILTIKRMLRISALLFFANNWNRRFIVSQNVITFHQSFGLFSSLALSIILFSVIRPWCEHMQSHSNGSDACCIAHTNSCIHVIHYNAKKMPPYNNKRQPIFILPKMLTHFAIAKAKIHLWVYGLNFRHWSTLYFYFAPYYSHWILRIQRFT